jgi:hypothetical protein
MYKKCTICGENYEGIEDLGFAESPAMCDDCYDAATTNRHAAERMETLIKANKREEKIGMKYYAQIFRDEIIYAGIYETCKNGNAKAVIISSVYRKAKKTTIQNPLLWMKIDIENVPAVLRRKLLDKAGL